MVVLIIVVFHTWEASMQVCNELHGRVYYCWSKYWTLVTMLQISLTVSFLQDEIFKTLLFLNVKKAEWKFLRKPGLCYGAVVCYKVKMICSLSIPCSMLKSWIATVSKLYSNYSQCCLPCMCYKMSCNSLFKVNCSIRKVMS